MSLIQYISKSRLGPQLHIFLGGLKRSQAKKLGPSSLILKNVMYFISFSYFVLGKIPIRKVTKSEGNYSCHRKVQYK